MSVQSVSMIWPQVKRLLVSPVSLLRKSLFSLEHSQVMLLWAGKSITRELSYRQLLYSLFFLFSFSFLFLFCTYIH
ncbi:hypothetical protein BCR42DRAFT_430122 [Absidia repens]|uniref:Uncharacterized protein n=1 Tax=Absidia repens TaxID=90262 RepID=A0A1X2HKJ3_9FUNG|nr:hypothetical protein BCR42DRAFT_430122 [Absidia repens]